MTSVAGVRAKMRVNQGIREMGPRLRLFHIIEEFENVNGKQAHSNSIRVEGHYDWKANFVEKTVEKASEVILYKIAPKQQTKQIALFTTENLTVTTPNSALDI